MLWVEIRSLGSKLPIKAVQIKREYLLTLQPICVISNVKPWLCVVLIAPNSVRSIRNKIIITWVQIILKSIIKWNTIVS